jgi:hypothetical protein
MTTPPDASTPGNARPAVDAGRDDEGAWESFADIDKHERGVLTRELVARLADPPPPPVPLPPLSATTQQLIERDDPPPRYADDELRLELLLADTFDPVDRRRRLVRATRPGARPSWDGDHPLTLLAVVTIAILVIWLAWGPAGDVIVSRYAPSDQVAAAVITATPIIIPPGEHSVVGAPTLNAAQIDEILASYGSPATGTGTIWIERGRVYGIDPAFALAFFVHESAAGTHPDWAGIKSDGATTHNIGNIVCAGYTTCYGRFRDYGDWAEGINDWYRLISVEYIGGRGVTTIEQIIPIYAPAFENDVPRYIEAVLQLVYTWRARYAP